VGLVERMWMAQEVTEITHLPVPSNITCISCTLADVVAWSVVGAATLSSASGESVTVTIATGPALPSFTVNCVVSGFGTKTLTVQGIADGTAKPMYLGVLSSALATTPEGPLYGNFNSGGNFYLGMDNIPYWYNGTAWKAVDTDTPNYAQIIPLVAGNSFNSGRAIPSTSAVIGFFRILFSNVAIINELFMLVVDDDLEGSERKTIPTYIE